MSLILQSSSGGQITVQEPATASNFTQTLPAATGTVMVSGAMPAFSAIPNTQAYSSNTWTKVRLDVEEFDTANAFDSTTNYRFTPTVAGYYQFNGYIETSAGSYLQTAIYKNGSLFKYTQQNTSPFGTTCSVVMFMNGTTDYVELYGFITTSGNILSSSSFSGFLARAA